MLLNRVPYCYAGLCGTDDDPQEESEDGDAAEDGNDLLPVSC